jgi:hypothetical protein
MTTKKKSPKQFDRLTGEEINAVVYGQINRNGIVDSLSELNYLGQALFNLEEHGAKADPRLVRYALCIVYNNIYALYDGAQEGEEKLNYFNWFDDNLPAMNKD